MRASRAFLAAAGCALLAACAGDPARLTAPADAAYEEADGGMWGSGNRTGGWIGTGNIATQAGGTWIGTGNRTGSDSTGAAYDNGMLGTGNRSEGGWSGSGNITSGSGGTWAGSGNRTEGDSTATALGGTWAGSGN